MKKIILFVFLMVAAYGASFAQVTGALSSNCTSGASNCNQLDCSDNQNVIRARVDGNANPAKTVTCFYADDTNSGESTGCPFIYNGGAYNNLTITNCSLNPVNAPINSGLIFLIVGGAGLGFFLLRRQARKDNTTFAN